MRKHMLLFLLTAALQAQVPGTITFQGVLTDAAGNPKPDGPYNVTFSLYTVPSAGTALWTQVSSVSTSRGVFSVQLGSTPFPSTMKFDVPYYLGITIQGGTELSPRVALNSAPYSMSAVRADTAKTVVDNGITSVKILDGTITNADINTSAAIAGTKISPDFGAQNIVTTGSVTASSFSGSIGSGNITAGSVDSTKLAANSVHSGKIADGSIVDTDINSSAGISGAKINPDFGAQNISTTGTVTASNFSGVVVTGGVGGTIGDGTITNTDISGAAQIATTKLSGNVTAIGGHGLGSLATKSTVDSSTITDGSITNADIRGNAGISGAKINPDFGSNNISTTGSLGVGMQSGTNGRLTIQDSSVPLAFVESDQPVNSGGLWRVALDAGTLRFDLNTSISGDFATYQSLLGIEGAGNFYIRQYTGSSNHHILQMIDGAGTEKFRFEDDGVATSYGGSWNTSSDKRLKKNIAPITNGLQTVLQLQGVKFDWIADGRTSIGFIAQDIEKFLPEIVATDKEGYKSVAYDKVTSVLVEAIKELKNENDELKKRIENLEKQIGTGKVGLKQ